MTSAQDGQNEMVVNAPQVQFPVAQLKRGTLFSSSSGWYSAANALALMRWLVPPPIEISMIDEDCRYHIPDLQSLEVDVPVSFEMPTRPIMAVSPHALLTILPAWKWTRF